MSEWQETPTHWLASDGKWYPSQQPVSPAATGPEDELVVNQAEADRRRLRCHCRHLGRSRWRD